MNARVVTLADLHEAWRRQAPLEAVATASDVNLLAGPVIAVIGAGGGAGATTVALALAEHLPTARLLECRTSPLSSLAAATTAELGSGSGRWQRGLREAAQGPVLIERASQDVTSPESLPVPIDRPHSESVTVLDVGWPWAQLTGWLQATVLEANAIVVVAGGTCPGLEHLEATLRQVEGHRKAPVTAVVRGVHLKRWPRPLQAAAGCRTHRLLARGELFAVDEDRSLHLLGLTPAPLPPAVAAVGEELARHLAGRLWTGHDHGLEVSTLKRNRS